ncbi:MAG TPA: peptidoglycan DD-metalloendopeptidase family protein [Thermoanaerobaculales bacterium]|nr:peptidoglycan DD-metalloendopeptidase family protein [Thermoanaerobaculales bacterium]
MTKKRLLIAAAISSSLGLLILPLLLGLVAVLFVASAQAAQNPCYGQTGIIDSGGPVRLPVVGSFTPTSEYGMRVNPGPFGGSVYKLHNGIDLVELPGPSTVVAAKDGVVTATPTEPTGGGNVIVLDHGAGLTTTYMHLSSRLVTVGERVWVGKPIGVEGTTGNSTGAHLHFTVKINGAPTDPRPWFAQNGITLPATHATGTAPAAVPVAPTGTSSSTSSPSPTLAPIAGTGTVGTTKPVVTQLPAKVGAYQGEKVLNAAYVIKAGQALGLDAKSITIGVMTAMGESSLRVLDYGDGAGPDSRGLFQQRANGAWGSYSDRMDPTISSTNFFKALMQVPNYLSLEPTIAAHKTQRNADPYYYTPFWAPAVEMVSVLTADPGLLAKLPPSGPIDGCENPQDPLPAGDGSGAAIVAAARHYLGTPYSWGGGNINGPSLGIYTSPSLDGTHTVGFDCSGLVLFAVYNSTGLQLDHSSETQGHDARGTTIPRDWAQMKPGDVIAFSQAGGARGTFGHVGIYIGNHQMIHAPSPGSSVEVASLDSPYYARATWAIQRYAKA